MMSTYRTRQHQTYASVYAGHVLSTVITMEDDDRAPIDPRGYETAYVVVANRLERRIRAGEFTYHNPLPSEPALTEWYGVSRTTIRSGIRLLAERGFVEVRPGKGTFVVWRPGQLGTSCPQRAVARHSAIRRDVVRSSAPP